MCSRLPIVYQVEPKLLDGIIRPLLCDPEQTLLEHCIHFVHVIVDWLAVCVSGFELLCRLTKFVGGLLAYLAGHIFLFLLRFGWHHLAQVWVDFLLDVEFLVKKLQIQRADFLILPIQQFQLVFLIRNVLHFHHCSRHLLLHTFGWDQVRFNFLVFIHHKSERLVEVYLFGWSEAFCCFELLASDAAQKPDESTLLWRVFEQSLKNVCLDGSFSHKVLIVNLYVCLFLVTLVLVHCNFNCASLFLVKQYLIVFFVSNRLRDLNQSEALKFILIMFVFFPYFNKNSVGLWGRTVKILFPDWSSINCVFAQFCLIIGVSIF